MQKQSKPGYYVYPSQIHVVHIFVFRNKKELKKYFILKKINEDC